MLNDGAARSAGKASTSTLELASQLARLASRLGRGFEAVMGRMWPSIWMLTRHHDRAHDMPGQDRAEPWPRPFIRYIVGTQLRVALSRDSKPGRLGRIYEAACWGRRGGVEPISRWTRAFLPLRRCGPLPPSMRAAIGIVRGTRLRNS
jgi:hypothetical protein